MMYVIRLQCKDTHGIVASVALALSEAMCNIEDSAQFHDPFSGQFFMRVVFSAPSEKEYKNFKDIFINVAEKFSMIWSTHEQDKAISTLLIVSQYDHCLQDILYRTKKGALNLDIKAIVSNHENCKEYAEQYGVPYHFLPIEKTDKAKADQEQKIREIAQNSEIDLIVLARYMQILSQEFSNEYLGKIINIHHSFLPGFKGAKPYKQAYERGVKIIGATAHFVTEELDEGPIIEQETIRVDHSYTPKNMQNLGWEGEARVLARAIKLFTEHRIFMSGTRTIIL